MHRVLKCEIISTSLLSTCAINIEIASSLCSLSNNLNISNYHNSKSYIQILENMSDINPAIEKYGWTAVPRDLSTLLSQSQASGTAKPISVSSIILPSTPLAKAVFEYAKKELPIEAFNHSMRVYYYGNPPSPSLCNFKINISKETESQTIYRPSNSISRLPNVVHPLIQRNLLPQHPPPRHRHYAPEHNLHSPLFRVLRRTDIAFPPHLSLLPSPPGRKRSRDHNPTSRSWLYRHSHSHRGTHSISDAF